MRARQTAFCCRASLCGQPQARSFTFLFPACATTGGADLSPSYVTPPSGGPAVVPFSQLMQGTKIQLASQFLGDILREFYL